MIIKRFNTILSKGEQKPCPTDLLFNPAYLTDTEWVSKTDAVPVLSLNGIDTFVTTPITINTNLNIELQFRYNQCNNGVAYQYIFGRFISGSLYFASVQTENNQFIFSFGNNSYTGTSILPTLNDGNIYNIQFIDKKFYFNGILLRDYTNASFTDVVDIQLTLGGLYSSQRSCVDLIYCKLWDSTQEALYTFDNISGTVIPDKSGNGNDAILGGSLTYCCSKRRVLLNNEDRTYLSKSNIEKVKAKLVNSTCVQTNGINNRLLIGAYKYVGNLIEGLNINITFQTTNDIKIGYYSAILTKRNATLGGSWGIVKSDTNNLTFVYYNQDNIVKTHPLLNIATNTLYDIKLQILNSYVIITINDNIVLNQLVDLTDFDLLNADFIINGVFYGGSLYLPLMLFNFTTSDSIYFDFTYNTNNTCYDQVTGTPYTISGDPVSIVTQDVLHSQLRNGFTVDGTNIYPPLLSNPLVDCVTGQPLTNPAKANGYNLANTELDFSQYIQNFLPEPYHPDDDTGFEDSQLFYRDRKPAYIDRLLLYANPIDSPCLDKTLKYCDIDYITDDNGNIIVEDDGITLIQQ